MRSDPADYELVAPGNLRAVVSLLADEPGKWLPIAGGTDVMVLYAAGKLPARKLVSIWNLPELRRIEISPDEIRIGAGCTYTELREHEIIAREFPLLASAARWTGGIANQNRGTLGGNIVNASPAADSLPALLVYEAENPGQVETMITEDPFAKQGVFLSWEIREWNVVFINQNLLCE